MSASCRSQPIFVHLLRKPAGHSPMLMATPVAKIYEVTESGMESVALEDTSHYFIMKSFLNDPASYLRHLDSE